LRWLLLESWVGSVFVRAVGRGSAAATVEVMPVRRLAGLAALCALAIPLMAPAAGAKILNGCAVLAPEELETIFEQPFRKGTVLQGSYCSFNKPAAADVPDIVVQVLVTRSKTVAKAKRIFDGEAATSQELAGSITDLEALGDGAFSAFVVGTDQVTVRVGKVVGRFRIDEPDSDDVYPEQSIAVATAAAPRLENYSTAG
jgi:hypothetical protein